MKATDIIKKISLMMDEFKVNEGKPKYNFKKYQGASSFSMMNAAVDCLRTSGLDKQADELISKVMKSNQDYVNTLNIIKQYVDLE